MSKFGFDRCPKCGGTDGFYTKGTVMQYYKCNGDPDGYEFTSEGTMAACLNCGKRIQLSKILRGKYRVGDTVWAIVKNSHFTAEVVCAKVVRVGASAFGLAGDVLVLEREKSPLTADRWEFPLDQCEEYVFEDESAANAALERKCGGMR